MNFSRVRLVLASLCGCLKGAPRAHIVSDFESGSHGTVSMPSTHTWRLEMREDNEARGLPNDWRGWFYVKMSDMPVGTPITLEVTGIPWSFAMMPFFSYDQATWQPFVDAVVSQPAPDVLRIHTQFTQRTFWLARWVPYTHADLLTFLKKWERHPDVHAQSLGKTPRGHSVPMLVVTDRSVTQKKVRIWIQARTHPGESPASFVMEGFIAFLLGTSDEAAEARRHVIFHIVPMHNIDGVIAGNYRSNLASVNLETAWMPAGAASVSMPEEVELLRTEIVRLMNDPLPITVALNLHASNEPAERPPFASTHFGPVEAGYSTEEARLRAAQLRIVEAVDRHHSPFESEDPGGRKFLALGYPETWWWTTYQDRVTALTIESVYGRVSPEGPWRTPADQRALGAALGRACAALYAADASKSPP